MRKKQVLQLLTMLTATAAVCAGLFLRHQPMEVAAVRVEKGNICRTVGVAGTVCYTQETPVTAMVSGMVDALYVIEGERVTQGQALARISGGAALLHRRCRRGDARTECVAGQRNAPSAAANVAGCLCAGPNGTGAGRPEGRKGGGTG